MTDAVILDAARGATGNHAYKFPQQVLDLAATPVVPGHSSHISDEASVTCTVREGIAPTRLAANHPCSYCFRRTPLRATSFMAMRLGMVIYIELSAFVLNPALTAQESALSEISYTTVFAILGVFFIPCAFDGWGLGVRRLMNIPIRITLIVPSLLTFAHELNASLLGLAISIAVLLTPRFRSAVGPGESAARGRARIVKLPSDEQRTEGQFQDRDGQEQLTESLSEFTALPSRPPQNNRCTRVQKDRLSRC